MDMRGIEVIPPEARHFLGSWALSVLDLEGGQVG